MTRGAGAAGAQPIIAVDPVAEKRALALELGAAAAVTPEEAADAIALLKTNIHMKLLFGRPARIGPAFIARSAKASVDLFLNGALPRER